MRILPALVPPLLALLTACTAGGSADGAAPSDPTPTPVPTIVPGTELAVGTFDPAEGTSGTVRVTAAARGGYDIVISDFSTDRQGNWELLFSPYPVDPHLTCLDRFAMGIIGSLDLTGTDATTYIGELGPHLGGEDPSWIDGAVLGQFIQQDRDENGCARTVVARAPFVWSMPDMRPGLVVEDGGTREAASGEVRLADGEPIEYVVASGDVLDVIGERFGITADDIQFLNPGRTAEMAIAGEVLNLDKQDRP
ncbi:MAG TPA: LysM domain-containing protein [Rhodoglobus sp.]|nr:LysM domain-containing protein [Rhodoglobus sp.]